jgi:thiamine pyrophosphate-dependent acetolactate synthase large subunit-like protein
MWTAKHDSCPCLSEEFATSPQELPDFDYASYAKLVGLEAVTLERPEQIRPGLKPCVVDAHTDPEVPLGV